MPKDPAQIVAEAATTIANSLARMEPRMDGIDAHLASLTRFLARTLRLGWCVAGLGLLLLGFVAWYSITAQRSHEALTQTLTVHTQALERLLRHSEKERP